MKKALTGLLAAVIGGAALFGAAPAALAASDIDVSHSVQVEDHANILSANTETKLTNLSGALQDACGAQIGVYTVENIGNTDISDYAYDVFNAWGLGDATEDNGVLILLVPGDDNYWVMQGEGLETSLPSSSLQSVLDSEMEPYWVRKDYDTGALETARTLAGNVAGIYGVELNLDAAENGETGVVSGESAPSRSGPGFGAVIFVVLLVVLLVVIILFAAVLPARRRRRYGYVPPRPRRSFFYPSRRNYNDNYYDSRPRRNNFGGFGGSSHSSHYSGGGHSSFGSGSGSHSSFGGSSGSHSSFGGSSHSSHSNGGGSSRGGGAGRR